MNKQKVTTYDVARHARVDQSTVSKVLSGATNFRKSTAQKVRRACEELGYVPNEAARVLRTQRTRTIAVHVPFGSETVLADPFIAEFLAAAGSATGKAGYNTILLSPGDSGDVDFATLIKSRRCDGVIITSPAKADKRVGEIARHDISCVTGRTRIPRPGRIACVDVDNAQAGFEAARFMGARGRRRVALLIEPPTTIIGDDFLAGFRSGVAGRNTSFPRNMVRRICVTASAAMSATRELLALEQRPDAIVASFGLATIGARQALLSQGVGDIDVLGPDSQLARELFPNSPWIKTPVAALGKRMAEVLVEMIETGKTPGEGEMLRASIVDENGRVFEE